MVRYLKYLLAILLFASTAYAAPASSVNYPLSLTKGGSEISNAITSISSTTFLALPHLHHQEI
jgi:hypothetical protein